MAAREGLHLPLVYNCGGYERIETLKILDGIVDIYMPDFKYMMRLQGDFVLYQPGKNGPLSN